MNLLIDEYSSRESIENLSMVLDHAIMKENDVSFDEIKNELTIYLRRAIFKKFLWFFLWIGSSRHLKKCRLTIYDVKELTIPETRNNEEILIGGIVIDANKNIMISSFCEKESEYALNLTVEKIRIYLDDLE